MAAFSAALIDSRRVATMSPHKVDFALTDRFQEIYRLDGIEK